MHLNIRGIRSYEELLSFLDDYKSLNRKYPFLMFCKLHDLRKSESTYVLTYASRNERLVHCMSQVKDRENINFLSTALMVTPLMKCLKTLVN